MRVALVDPGQQVPFYCRGLAGGLVNAGADVTFYTAPLLYYGAGPAPPGVAIRHAFGRWLPRVEHGDDANIDREDAPNACRDDLPPPPRTPMSRWIASRPVLRRILRGAGYPWEVAAFVRDMVRQRPDIVHWQWSLWPAIEVCAVRRLRRAGIAVVHTAHNVVPHEVRPWHAPPLRRLYAAVDRVIVHSQATRARLLALGGIAPERVRVVPMAAAVPAAMPERAAARRALGLDVDAKLALFFGHVRPYKGLGDLLAAWPHVLSRVPDARLVIAGPLAGGRAAAERIAALARPAAHTLDWRLGFVPSPATTDYFAAADVVALPYRTTDDSAVLATALAHGRAVVATAVGGLPEALAGGGGRLVPPGDGAALAAAIADVLGMPAERQRLEGEARAAAAAWTWTDAGAATVGVYGEKMEERASW